VLSVHELQAFRSVLFLQQVVHVTERPGNLGVIVLCAHVGARA
jgi:hypothetical protein